MKVHTKKPSASGTAGKHTVHVYKGKTVTIGNKTGSQAGGNFGGKGKLK